VATGKIKVQKIKSVKTTFLQKNTVKTFLTFMRRRAYTVGWSSQGKDKKNED